VSASPARNDQLLLPYVLPYAAYVGLASLGGLGLSPEATYALQIAGTAAALAFSLRSLRPLTGPRPLAGSLALGSAAGIAGAALWLGAHDRQIDPGGEPWSPAYVALRALAAVGLVPLFEEQLMRGYVLGLATQWDRARAAGDAQAFDTAFTRRSIAQLEPGAATWLAIALSSIAFAAGHAPSQWPVALLYGAGMALLWKARGDLACCVAAHATTNAIQIAYLAATGRFTL
jgi:uncharacterized protein